VFSAIYYNMIIQTKTNFDKGWLYIWSFIKIFYFS